MDDPLGEAPESEATYHVDLAHDPERLDAGASAEDPAEPIDEAPSPDASAPSAPGRSKHAPLGSAVRRPDHGTTPQPCRTRPTISMGR